MKRCYMAHTIKPSVKAFPITWFWIGCYVAMLFNVKDSNVQMMIAIFLILTPLLIMLIATYGRSYIYNHDEIIKINHITGSKESIRISAIGQVKLRPIVLGYGHVILTLANGEAFKIKNIKLPKDDLLESLLVKGV